MSTADRTQRNGGLAALRRQLLYIALALQPVASWTFDNFPLVGRLAFRRRARVVLEPYSRGMTLRGAVLAGTAVLALGFICLLYGFFFGLTAPYLLVPFAVPIAIITVLVIWALPDQRTAPTLGMEVLFPAAIVALVIWPNYLAVSLPGVPWISAQRLIGLPLAGFLLVSLSVSAEFRRRVAESVNASKPIWILLCAYVAVQILTTPLSEQPITSAQTVFNHQINFTMMFVIGAVLFRDVRYVERYWALLCLIAIPIVLVTAFEFRRQYIPWAAHIPRILHPPDPSVEIILTPNFRPGINLYRAKATFQSPLALAEYLSLLTPFLLHFGFHEKNLYRRLLAFGFIPIVFIAVRMTDARLGVVGMLVSVLLYGVYWSFQRWRTRSRDLFAAATMYAYPAAFVAGIGLVFASNRLHAMVFGDGAQAGSSAARDTQLAMAIAKLKEAPWGHGASMSGISMGYAEGAFLTIDNYFIGIALDYGVLGIIFWYGIFVAAILEATRYSLSDKFVQRPEARLLAPLAVCFVAFLVVKWVHGQDYNHGIYFMMLGMISALIYRLRFCPPPDPATA